MNAAQKMKRNRLRNTRLRAGIQIFFFLMAPALFTTGFSGVKYIFNQIASGSSLTVNSFVMTLIVLCALTMLFGRFFCGYICAFGSLGDGVNWLSGVIQKKLKKKLPKIPENVTAVLKYLPFVVLTAIVVLCATGVYSSLSGWSPWDVFSMLTALNFRFSRYILGIVLLAFILVGMALESRFFCRFLCPLGAVFRLMPILPWSVLRRDRNSCIKGCSACKKNCPVNLELSVGQNAGDCIRCGKCASFCPKQNIADGLKPLHGREMLVTVGKAMIFLIAAGVLGALRIL